jgi:hypothetical protein
MRYDYVKVAVKSPIRITGWMKFYAPGEFLIPAIKVKYTCASCSAGEVKTAETNAANFRVSSIVPSQQRENKLVIPKDDVAPDYRTEFYRTRAKRYLFIGISSLLAAALRLIKISPGTITMATTAAAIAPYIHVGRGEEGVTNS